MRFFLNHERFESIAFLGTHNVPKRIRNNGSLTDSSYERRNATYPDDFDFNDEEIRQIRENEWAYQCEGNERTPIRRLPEEIIKYIFELGSKESKPIYSWDVEMDDEHPLALDEIVVGHYSNPRSLSLMDADEALKSSFFLHSASAVCRWWMSVAGPIHYRVVLVDGLLSDYDRALTILGSGFPGVSSKAKGSFVRELTIDVKGEFVDSTWKIGQKVTQLLRTCPNVQRLVLRGNSGFEVDDAEMIWKEGIAALAPALVYLEWTLDLNPDKALSFIQNLKHLSLLTELVLEDNDKIYVDTECESISLPLLHTYRLLAKHSSIMRFQAKWDMRSLKHLDLSVGPYEDSEEEHDGEAVRVFFDAHGLGLKYLDITKFTSLPGVIQPILDRTPRLLQLALPIGLLNSNDRIHHDGLRLLFISGFYLPGNHRNASVGTYLAMFAQRLRKHYTFPRVEFLKIRHSTARELGTRLSTEAMEEWKEWFQIEESYRPAIIDYHNQKVSLNNLRN